MTLNDPLALVLLILAPVVVVLIVRPKQRANLRFSTLRDVSLVGKSWRIRGRRLLVVARVLCIILLVVALARPRMGNKQSKRFTKGVVMELVVDPAGFSVLNRARLFCGHVLFHQCRRNPGRPSTTGDPDFVPRRVGRS